MEGRILKRVDSFSTIHFVKDGKPVPVCRRGISAEANEDGLLSDDQLQLMLDSIQETANAVDPQQNFAAIEYTLTYDADTHAWTAECYF